MVKFATPKRVTLPNGRTFVVRYKRIKRRQQGQGIFDFVRKVAKNPLVKTIAKKGLEYAPGIYHNLSKRVKNKTLKRILNSDAAHLALNKAIKTANNRLGG